MKLNQLEDILNNFIDNKNLSAILINGDWGIGKTHTVLSYMNSHKSKNIKYAYVSLFGKKSLDELNTDLYNQLNPMNKALNVINHVVKLVGAGISLGSGVNINLAGNEFATDKKIKRHKKQIVVICDDLERINENITTNEIIGYFNELILQGIKIVVLANLQKDNDFGEYKEKVLDRIYQINETQEDVIKEILSKHSELFNDNIVNLIDNNLRMLKKSVVLYEQILNYLSKNQIENINKEEIMSICLCVVIDVLTEQITKLYIDQMSEENKKYLKYYDAESIRADAISKHIMKDNNLKDFANKNLISAIVSIYQEEDYKALISYFKPQNQGENIFSSLFFDSDAKKLEKIKKQYDYILNLNSSNDAINNMIENVICEWYTYCKFLDLSFIDEKKLFEKFIELNIEIDVYFRATDRIIALGDRFQDYKNIHKCEFIIEKLNNFEQTKSFKETLYEIYRNYSNLDALSKQNIKDTLVKNKFYTEYLSGDISPEYWSIIHIVCGMVNEMMSDMKPKLLSSLNEELRKHPDDQSLNMRIIGLIEQYKIKDAVK